MEKEVNMWRFLMGIVVGISISIIIMTALPVKWNSDPDRETINKSQDKFIMLIGVDQSLDFVSQHRINTYNDTNRIIHTFRNQKDADEARKCVVDAWNSYNERKK